MIHNVWHNYHWPHAKQHNKWQRRKTAIQNSKYDTKLHTHTHACCLLACDISLLDPWPHTHPHPHIYTHARTHSWLVTRLLMQALLLLDASCRRPKKPRQQQMVRARLRRLRNQVLRSKQRCYLERHNLGIPLFQLPPQFGDEVYVGADALRVHC